MTQLIQFAGSFVFVAVFSLAVSVQAIADVTSKQASSDWPCWRGPNHDGISAEKNWKAEWPKNGPKKVWSAKVGTGFSSVAVADGKLYTAGHEGDDDTIFCFNAVTGEELWKYSYRCELVANLHEGGPASTPTVDSGRVFTCSKEGHVFCFDAASGNVVWKAELQPLLDVKMPAWGFSASPLIVGDLMILEAGRLVAFKKATGEVVWKTDKFSPGYGSAVPFPIAGREQPLVATLNNEFLVVVDSKDGVIVDKTPWTTSFATSATTPVVNKESIFISTGYNRGCALFAFADDKLNKKYENKNMRNHMNNCVLYEENLYGVDGNSHDPRHCSLVCLNHATGEVRWKEQGAIGCGSLMLADGKLIILSDKGELITAPATPDGYKPISKAQVIEGRCWTVPVLARGYIYCRDAPGNLVCLDVRK